MGMGADERWGLRSVDEGCGEFAGLVDSELRWGGYQTGDTW